MGSTSLFDKRLVFVTGKGGVGKTTVAAALGLAAARQGKRVVVCEVARADRMSRVFRAEGVGYRETELSEGLWAMSVDPEHALEEYLRDQLHSGTLTRLLMRSNIFTYLTAAAPGVRELVTIGKVWELAQLQRRRRQDSPFDMVVVDAPPTGHGLGLLRAPRTFRDIARVGPIHRQAGHIDEFVTNPRRTAVLVVALPEEMPVNETLEFGERLKAEMGMGIHAILVNAVYPTRFTREEAGVLESASANGTVGAALRAAVREHRIARSQLGQVTRLRDEAPSPVRTLPYLFAPEIGLPEIRGLARNLVKAKL
jgi:anion-transporting  ArsA/GET3 family ATPase